MYCVETGNHGSGNPRDDGVTRRTAGAVGRPRGDPAEKKKGDR